MLSNLVINLVGVFSILFLGIARIAYTRNYEEINASGVIFTTISTISGVIYFVLLIKFWETFTIAKIISYILSVLVILFVL